MWKYVLMYLLYTSVCTFNFIFICECVDVCAYVRMCVCACVCWYVNVSRKKSCSKVETPLKTKTLPNTYSRMDSIYLTTFIHALACHEVLSCKLYNLMIILDATSDMIQCEFLVCTITLPGGPVSVVGWSCKWHWFIASAVRVRAPVRYQLKLGQLISYNIII